MIPYCHHGIHRVIEPQNNEGTGKETCRSSNKTPDTITSLQHGRRGIKKNTGGLNPLREAAQ